MTWAQTSQGSGGANVGVLGLLALLLVYVLFCSVRWVRSTPEQRRARRLGWRIRRTWKHLAMNLKLSYADQTAKHRVDAHGNALPMPVRRPRIRVRADDFGARVVAGCLPGVSLAEYQNAAPYLADAWGCPQVVVTQERPGSVVLRALLADPLERPYVLKPHTKVPGKWELHLGRDDHGEEAVIPLRDNSGITVGGLPGYGKTSLQHHWISQLAPSPAVQFAFLDGKVSNIDEGDYAEFADRAFLTCGDDMEQANKALKTLCELRRSRAANMRKLRGTTQFWAKGPTPDMPLVFVIIDESHTFVQTSNRKTKALAEENALLLEDLAKKGRSAGFVLIIITQKQTGDAIPTSVRDVCQVGLSYAVKTDEAAVAALGADIRQYPDASPTTLVGDQYRGVCVASLADRPGFSRIRTPHVAENDAALVVRATEKLTSDPGILLEAQLLAADFGPAA